jgi:lipoprotein-anchoring transpeptidase ErfK/SrfK
VPVYATLVSTGKEGYETPRGVFRILAKHVSNPMDDFTLGEPYAIDEVPYVMYFQQNVALHGAFWHRGFGAVRSHGCVNLTPIDAHWLFDWVHPFRPEGWHGVYSTDTDPGTIVWVRKS